MHDFAQESWKHLPHVSQTCEANDKSISLVVCKVLICKLLNMKYKEKLKKRKWVFVTIRIQTILTTSITLQALPPTPAMPMHSAPQQ